LLTINLYNSASDDGVMPLMRPAAPSVRGLATRSFSRSSFDSWPTLPKSKSGGNWQPSNAHASQIGAWKTRELYKRAWLYTYKE